MDIQENKEQEKTKHDPISMDVKEFREKGYLQEANRRFFHPLGLALSVEIDKDTGVETLSKIWDYRNDPEGIVFDISRDEIPGMQNKADFISKEIINHEHPRVQLFGNIIQPIKETNFE